MLPTALAATLAIPKNDDAEERDFETRIVPEIHTKASSSVKGNGKLKGASSSSRKTIVGPAEKENRRMKRLLRNRVSAQQARERRKAYLIELESKTKVLEQKNAELQERVSTLQRENFMLRQIVKNATMNRNPSSVTSVSNLEA